MVFESFEKEKDKDSDWQAYIEGTKEKPVRQILIEAVEKVEYKDRALDLGAGGLRTSRYLLEYGFQHVDAVDSAKEAKKEAGKIQSDKFTFYAESLENFFPQTKYDLVNAEFSLPFVPKEHFREVIQKSLTSVKPGGIFTGQLFGPKHSWNISDSETNFLDEEDAKKFFDEFEILKFDVVDKYDEKDKTHWHTFHIIARRVIPKLNSDEE